MMIVWMDEQGQVFLDLNEAQVITAKRKIKEHYQLKRKVTGEEVAAELKNLIRKDRKGTLDDYQQRLMNDLRHDPHGISWRD